MRKNYFTVHTGTLFSDLLELLTYPLKSLCLKQSSFMLYHSTMSKAMFTAFPNTCHHSKGLDTVIVRVDKTYHR